MYGLVTTARVVNLKSHGACLMNYAQATLSQRRISQRSENDRNLPPVRNSGGARTVPRALEAGTWTPTARPSSRANRWATSFYPAALLPPQFVTEPGRSSEGATGAHRLMFAVLQDAVACWFRYADGATSRKRRLFQETYEWLWTLTPGGLYAFENICAMLKLDPDYIRRGLLRWHPNVEPQHTQPNMPRTPILTRRATTPYPSILRVPSLAAKKSRGL